MAQYRKKPVVIEAVQWDGNLETLSIFPKKDIENVKLRDGDLYIQTLEGEMKANVGDYIIRGVKGEYYPCKPDIFEATYEQVSEMSDEVIKQKLEAELGPVIDKMAKDILNGKNK